MFLSEIPGYTRAGDRADRLEDYWRDFAFLGLNEELRFSGGRKVEVRQLTLRMFVQLCAVRSPFLVGGYVGPEHVAQILWRLSPEYDLRANSPDVRKNFITTIASLPFKPAVRTISRYLDRMLIDKPPVPVKSNGAKSDTSFAASVIHALAKIYGWSDEMILDQPMPRLFQYLRKIRRDGDPDMVCFNPIRDRLTSRITTRFLAERKRSRNGDSG